MMQEQDVNKVSALEDVPILDEHDPEAQHCLCESSAFKIAEADDMVRLHDLLHRAEYRPVALVRRRCEERQAIRVYFTRLDET